MLSRFTYGNLHGYCRKIETTASKSRYLQILERITKSSEKDLAMENIDTLLYLSQRLHID